MGERYRSIRSVQVGGLALLAAPATGGFHAVLPTDETVTVEFDPPPHATAISARPERYSELETVLVPENERKGSKYVGYALIIGFDKLAESFEKVSDA